MNWKQLLARKSLETLAAEAAGENRLRRVLGPVSLTSLGVGAIIGAGIFSMTGRIAAEDAGPSIMISFVVAGVACALAALCYSEFASMAPVAGSAYTYAYATLGELCAWIIGWDLVLEYAMSCAVVAAHWAHYLEEFVMALTGWQLPKQLLEDPFQIVSVDGVHVRAWCNLPAALITLAVTAVLVLGIRESAVANTLLVLVKVGVVLFVICLGAFYVTSDNWTSIPVERRPLSDVGDYLNRNPLIAQLIPPAEQTSIKNGNDLLKKLDAIGHRVSPDERETISKLGSVTKKWGLLGVLGLREWLVPIDDAVRSPFSPYGFSGIMLGAALAFFAYIGFDSIATHSEEAVRPQRDVPIGILASLVICTVLYMLVSAVITGMEPYPRIDPDAAMAAAFRQRQEGQGWLLRTAAAVIATGALAGMTSVLLVTFLSQARIFLAMARDGLLPPAIFGAIHERFRTPHRSTILTGVVMALVAALTPIRTLEEMVSIGTLLAFVVVCAAVLILRVTRPEAKRPFHCPLVWAVAPLGILVNLTLMLFLPLDTWGRLVIWLAIGLAIYFSYSWRHSALRQASAI